MVLRSSEGRFSRADHTSLIPLREWDQFVKSPPVFLSEIDFVRDYVPAGTGPIPQRIILKVRASFAGPAELTLSFDWPGHPFIVSFARSVVSSAPGGPEWGRSGRVRHFHLHLTILTVIPRVAGRVANQILRAYLAAKPLDHIGQFAKVLRDKNLAPGLVG